MRWALIAMLSVGCYRPGPGPTCGEGECEDAPAADVSATQVCAGDPNGLMGNICFDPPPAARTIEGEIDTSRPCDELLASPPRDICIVAGESITVQGAVRAKGKRPLVLWSATTIEVMAGATLDVGSHNQDLGAGASDASCPALDGDKAEGQDPHIGSGGCGGAFSDLGGGGGDGRAVLDTVVAVVASSCTAARTTQPLLIVRGGCKGGDGGISNSVGSLNGGHSGGAVYLMAASSINVRGVIDARGAAGRVANSNASRMAGGGGGGSGGLIGFDTPMLSLDGAVLNALGGGGSSGAGRNGDATMVFQGNPGTEPILNPPAFASPCNPTVVDNTGGGGGQSGGESGGNSTETGGGGGGGGGSGYIRVYGTSVPMLTESKIAPPLSFP